MAVCSLLARSAVISNLILSTTGSSKFSRDCCEQRWKLSRRALKVRGAVGEDAQEPKIGKSLWRDELRRSSDEVSSLNSSLDDDFLRTSSLQKDIERLKKKREVEKSLDEVYGAKKSEGWDGSSIQDVVDKLLVADFFFILFVLTWLVVGLGEQALLNSSGLINTWLRLWPTLFQPALGIFMAGALVSFLTKKKVE